MTRRSARRAQAREIYSELAAAQPLAPDAGSDLTARVRALYEDSAVPVRDIAAIGGVTERTIYKYAARQRWKKRYARAGFAPVKGAGARFIRRDDRSLPIVRGLKATDPTGRTRAALGCSAAARLSDEAQRQAQAAQRAEATIRAIEWTNRAFKELRAHWAARDQQGGVERDRQRDRRQYPGARRFRPRPDRVERLLTAIVNMALSRWEALVREEEQSGAG